MPYVDESIKQAATAEIQRKARENGWGIVHAAIAPVSGHHAEAPDGVKYAVRVGYALQPEAYMQMRRSSNVSEAAQVLPGTDIMLMPLDVRDGLSSVANEPGMFAGGVISPYIDAVASDAIVVSPFMQDMGPIAAEAGPQMKSYLEMAFQQHLAIALRFCETTEASGERAPRHAGVDADRPAFGAFGAAGGGAGSPKPEDAYADMQRRSVVARGLVAVAALCHLAQGELPVVRQLDFPKNVRDQVGLSLSQAIGQLKDGGEIPDLVRVSEVGQHFIDEQPMRGVHDARPIREEVQTAMELLSAQLPDVIRQAQAQAPQPALSAPADQQNQPSPLQVSLPGPTYP